VTDLADVQWWQWMPVVAVVLIGLLVIALNTFLRDD